MTFKTGDVILVYGEMDEDGFYMGELDGVRGLVPSNFLTDAPDQYSSNQMGGSANATQRNMNNRGRGQALNTRGGPQPPRDGMGAMGAMGAMGTMGTMSTMGTMGGMNQRGQQRKGMLSRFNIFT